MKKFDLDTPLMQFGINDKAWTIRNAVEGVQLLGGIGSGKSSSAKTLALKYLREDFGGLILTVKNDERDTWKQYCLEAGRLDDLLVIEPGGDYSFDFLEYLSSSGKGSAITDNILETLKTVIRASNEKSGKSDDAFWEEALDQLLYNTIDLCALAYGRTGVQLLYDIIVSAPNNEAPADDRNDTREKPFDKAFGLARSIVEGEISEWYESLSKAQKDVLQKEDTFETAVLEYVPKARMLKFLDQFFFDTYKNLASKTRSIVEFSFSGFLFRLLRDPVYSLFCKTERLSAKPSDSLDGKIILLNLPVKTFHKVGRDCQILFKYLWQVEMEKRDVMVNNRPCFLWADESQHFLHEHDAIFQATARSSRIATVYITQNLPNYYAAMSGSNAENRVLSFLGTLATKLFFANADLESNKYGSELIGDSLFLDPSRSVTTAENFSQSDSLSLKIDRRIRPEDFIGLTTGGKRNNYRVEAFIHVQGDKLFNGENFKKVKFNQNYY